MSTLLIENGREIGGLTEQPHGIVKMTIGWTNLNPLASFIAQAITLSDTDYDALEIDVAYYSSSTLSNHQTFKLQKGKSNFITLISASSTNLLYFYRNITDDGNGTIQISRGARIQQGVSSETEANQALIPLEIRLIKYV